MFRVEIDRDRVHNLVDQSQPSVARSVELPDRCIIAFCKLVQVLAGRVLVPTVRVAVDDGLHRDWVQVELDDLADLLFRRCNQPLVKVVRTRCLDEHLRDRQNNLIHLCGRIKTCSCEHLEIT